MKVNFCHICEMAFVSRDNNTLNIIRIFNRIHAQSLPAIQPRFFVVFNVSGVAGTYKYTIKILDPDKVSIANSDDGFTIQSPDSPAGILTEFVGLTFPKHGEYTMSLWVDGTEIDSIKLNID